MPRSGHTLIKLLRTALMEYERDRARYFAVAMVYYALVSLIPLLLLMLALLGLLLRFSRVAAEARQYLLATLDASFGPRLPQTIRELLTTLQEGSIVATIVSLVGLMLTASVLFGHLRQTIRAIWKYEPPLASGSVGAVLRVKIVEKVIAFAMVLGGGVLLLVALVLIAVTQWLTRMLGELPVSGQLTGWLLTAGTSFSLAALTFAPLFKFLPPVSLRWRDVWLAAVLSGLAWVAAGEFLTLYGIFFGHNRSAYGAIGGLLAFMLWMNIVGQVLFYGAELCKVVATRNGGLPEPSPGR